MIYLILFFEFFKIGLFTFGGGYAMIPLIKETVLKYGWISESSFYDFIGVCESTPGPVAINMATYVGSTQGGFLGSCCATFGVVLPSFIIILLVVTLLTKLLNHTYTKYFLSGVKPIIMALILSTGCILFAKSIGYVNIHEFHFSWQSLVIFTILTLVYFFTKFVLKKKLNAIFLILLSAVLGIVISII